METSHYESMCPGFYTFVPEMASLLHTCQLKNGIQLIHRPNQSDVAHFGLIVHTGTRDENPDEHGLAHFMEHMFFKGTTKRSAYQIISRLEDVGGEINAYTAKEETALHASFLKQDYLRAIELIQDIFLHSSFPEKEREKEAEVILSEIQGYDDSPSELIFDRAEELLFPNHSIGRNILGTEESLGRFRNGMLENFHAENYATDEIVLSSVGNLSFAEIKKTAEKYFGSIPQKSRTRKRFQPETVSAKRVVEKRNTYQKHCMMLGSAYALPDQKRLQLYLLNNILGGSGMNSRLNMALRERRGYSYSAESHYAPYTDTGAMMIYFSSDAEKFDLSMRVVRDEIRKLRTTLIADSRLKHARKQMMGQLAISHENNEHLMLSSGKSFLIFNRVDSHDTILKKLEEITVHGLRETANEILDPHLMNILIFE
ncbi:MAG: insulinase family protein [Anaerolineales bacterium]|nr:insulinase family protein [Anaerolineales bacterium]